MLPGNDITGHTNLELNIAAVVLLVPALLMDWFANRGKAAAA